MKALPDMTGPADETKWNKWERETKRESGLELGLVGEEVSARPQAHILVETLKPR